MAQRTVVELLDDIDGKPAEESITFALDGVMYEIDLSSKNADKLRKGLAPFVEKARKAGAARGVRRRAGTGVRATSDRERSADIRTWAKQHGLNVNDRGRIPANVVEAYEAGNPALAKAAPKRVPEAKFQA
jgi:hypothetical protein